MSIRKARINGKDVYSSMGEELRGADVVCLHCGAHMHVHKFPLREDYYFALNPGEMHTSVCKFFEGEKDAQVLDGLTPASLIALLSTPQKRSGKSGNKGSGRNTGPDDNTDEKEYKPHKITSLNQIIKIGTFDELPYEQAYNMAGLRNIDFYIFVKWARLVWKKSLVPINDRVIDTRWIGSFSGAEAEAISTMTKTHELWFKTFWTFGSGYRSVRFCVDARSCFADIKKKLFTSGARENGTYNDFMPQIEKLDVLIAARWAIMNKEQCREKCPFKKCEGCLGAYWGKINTRRQIALFPDDELTKNKEKKIDG